MTHSQKSQKSNFTNTPQESCKLTLLQARLLKALKYIGLLQDFKPRQHPQNLQGEYANMYSMYLY